MVAYMFYKRSNLLTLGLNFKLYEPESYESEDTT